MQEKINQLSLGEKLVVGGAIVVFIASFLDWAQASVSLAGFGSESRGDGGWGDPGSIWSMLAIIICVALAGIIVAVKFGNMTMPSLSNGISWGMIYGGGAVLVIIFMLLKAWRITALPGCPEELTGDGVSCEIGFAVGYYIAFIGAVVFAVGGYLLYQEDKGVGFQGLAAGMKK